MNPFSEQLQCEWDSWVALGARRLRLYLPDDNCCDMTGAIAIATLLMPGVTTIECYAGAVRDTVYKKSGDGWLAQ